MEIAAMQGELEAAQGRYTQLAQRHRAELEAWRLKEAQLKDTLAATIQDAAEYRRQVDELAAERRAEQAATGELNSTVARAVAASLHMLQAEVAKHRI